MRQVIFHPKARDAIHRFPKEARTRLGRGLFRLQMGESLGMPKLKPIIAATPEALAGALGLSLREAKEWQVQHALLTRLKEIARERGFTHAEIARRSGTSRTRVTAILNDDLEHVSTDLLIRVLASLGYRVQVSVVRAKTAA